MDPAGVAAAAGVASGDALTAVDGVDVTGLTEGLLQECVAAARRGEGGSAGADGKNVVLTFARGLLEVSPQ